MDCRIQNRATRRAAAKFLTQESQKWPSKLTAMPHSAWPTTTPDKMPQAIWRSNRFLVQSYAVKGHPTMTRLSVCRTTIDGDGNWREDISWEDLQAIKAECGYGDHEAVELFPRDADVVNVANMRHLWIYLRGGPEFIWRKKP